MASSPRIDELRKKFEENPRRYFAPLANEYRKAGDIEQAIAICREYLPQQPGHMSGHIVFGQALFEAKQFDEAKTVFETALSLDPENLIALKHLGDITFASGDKEAAKGWYKRVLDADPRNEETLAQLALIEGPKPAAAATPASPQQATPTSKTMPMPAAQPAAAASAPTVVMKAMKVGQVTRAMPAQPAPGTPGAPAAPAATAAPTAIPTLGNAATVPIQVPPTIAPTEEIKVDGLSHGEPPATRADAGHANIPSTLIMEAPHGLTPVAAHEAPPVMQTSGLETTSLGGEAAPVDSFSLEGLETTSLTAPPPAPAPVAAAPEIELDMPAAPAPMPAGPAAPAAAPAGAEGLPTIDLDFAAPATTPAPPPPAAPVVAAAPVDESGLVELDISIPAAPAAAVAPAPPPAPPPAPVEIDVPAMAAPVAPAGAPEPAPVELEIEVPTPAPVAAPAPVPVAAAAPAPAPEKPFVTETMAELYLKQGHRDEALRVYRELLEKRPGDAALQAKVDELSAPTAPPMPAHVPAPDPVHPPLPAAAGPSIRALLLLIAQRRPGYRPGSNGAAAHADAAPVAHADHAPVGTADALGVLWGGSAPSPEEEAAAIMLYTAFSDLDGHTHANGALDLAPAAAAAAAAQAAQSAAAAGGTPVAPQNFSFDKFFSQRVTAEHAAQAQAKAGAPAESKEDVAQFTQWLEGLKKH